MKNALRIAGKELRDVSRERSILVAILVQFFIAAFSTFLLFGLTALYDPGDLAGTPPATVAYVGPGGFDAYLDEPNLRLTRMAADTARAAFEGGRLEAVVEETLGPEDARTVTLLLPEGELQATLLITQMHDLLADYEKDLRQERQERLEQRVLVHDTDLRPERPYLFVYTTLLPLLLLTPVFLSGAITGDSFEQELQTHTLGLLRAAPVGAADILFGKLLVPVLLAPAQGLLWIGLLAANGIAVQGLTALPALSLLLAVLLASVGLLVALWVRREHQTQEIYALVVLLLAGLSLFLPRDPLNLIARLATGTAGASDALSFGIVTVLAAAAMGAAVVLARGRLRVE